MIAIKRSKILSEFIIKLNNIDINIRQLSPYYANNEYTKPISKTFKPIISFRL